MVAGGGGTSRVITEDGAFTSGSTELRTEQVQVFKCKDCGEILNQGRNYHYTAEELAQLEAERLAKQQKAQDQLSWVGFVLVGLFALLFLAATIYAVADKREFGVIVFGLVSTLIIAAIAWYKRPSKFR